MPTCEHREFASLVIVTRITRSKDDLTVIGYRATATVKCRECSEPFLFLIGSAKAPELTVDLQPASSTRTPPGVN